MSEENGSKNGPDAGVSTAPEARDSVSSPERFQIPVQLIEQWAGLPMGERINAPLTKQDIDQLMFGLLRSNEAQRALEQTLVHWSNGRVDDANIGLAEFRRLNTESDNNIRQFIIGMMVSAIRGRNGSG